MKNPLIICIAMLTIVGCFSNTHKESVEDSLNFYPPTPKNVPKKEFRRIYNAAEAFYDSALLRTGFNGQFLVAKGGTIIIEKYYGKQFISTGDSINEHTPFHIASTSKTLTGGAILKLWEQGKLSLDDSLTKYFPGFPYPTITIKMLLTQRSGLPGYNRFEKKPDWDFEKIVSNQDMLNYIIKYKPHCDHAPGKAFQYSNTNFALLALIIEKVSGKSYGEFMKETFFIPLQMNDTYVYTHADSARALPSYNWRGQKEAYTFLDEIYGDKNIYSTVHDLLKWDQALYSASFFKPATLEAAYTPYSNEKKGINNYGLGWRMKVYPDEKKIIYHNGWWHGNNSCFQRLIQDSATIIVLGNRFNRNIYHCNKMANIFASYDEEDGTEE
ncbi:MAG: class A beta-lactamase-related serine hydrolase [Sphingobacteriales bacterium]|nr:MAG: class A beta-lactamase-related serine hydrolase [Sphingobacteriales bacterium]